MKSHRQFPFPHPTAHALPHARSGLVGSSFFVLFSISGVLFGFAANRIKTKWLLMLLSLAWAAAQFPLVGTMSFTAAAFPDLRKMRSATAVT